MTSSQYAYVIREASRQGGTYYHSILQVFASRSRAEEALTRYREAMSEAERARGDKVWIDAFNTGTGWFAHEVQP